MPGPARPRQVQGHADGRARSRRHLARGLRSVDPAIEISTVPVADGGDGLLDAAVGVRLHPGRGRGRRTGRPPARHVVRRRGREAVVEMAEICGLTLLGDELAPLTATSRGVGEAIAAALDGGADRDPARASAAARRPTAVPGSCAALGARLLDARGDDVPDGGGALGRAATLDLTGLHPSLRPGADAPSCWSPATSTTRSPGRTARPRSTVRRRAPIQRRSPPSTPP